VSAQQAPEASCRVQVIEFERWQAPQISNTWVIDVSVPRLGGRVMQVHFEGHPDPFVNPKCNGQYFPPVEAAARHSWFDSGDDKIWPTPEGDENEHHGPGPISEPLSVKLTSVLLRPVEVSKPSQFDQTIVVPAAAAELSMPRINALGKDRGPLGTVKNSAGDKNS
jgi:hypothetical protein